MVCVICDKIRERKAHLVYEDELVVCIMPAKPAALGHMKVMPKAHFTKLEELGDELVERLFMIANYSSAAAFDTLKSHGTNIILNEGPDHLTIDVIPRKEGDGMDFLWPPKDMPPDEMESFFSKIKDKAFVIGHNEKKEQPAPSVERSVETIVVPEKKEDVCGGSKGDVEPEEENYLIKHLTRIP
ncbi:HIT family protein [Candidatus Woesearchaeota archaeon]|nr:HIT family protein [Candidatus Woesearchaeota archaeon]